MSAVGPPSGGQEQRRLEWLLERHPDLAVNDEDGNECMFRRDELLVPAEDMATVTDAIGWIDWSSEAHLGIVRLRIQNLGRLGDLIDVSRTLNDRLGVATAPNHVLCGEAVYPGGAVGQPRSVAEPGLPSPRAGLVRPRPPSPQAFPVTLLDTGWVGHPWFADGYDILDPDQQDIGDPWDVGRGGLAGHGTFTAGMVLAVQPDARLRMVRVLDGTGLCDEMMLLRTLERQPPDGSITVLPFGGYLLDDRPTPALEAAVSVLSSNGLAVAAAGNAGLDRPFWPAASPQVIAVGAMDAADARPAPFNNRGPWVDVLAAGVNVTSAYLAGGTATWSGTSFAAGVAAGALARVATNRLVERLSELGAALPEEELLRNLRTRVLNQPGELLERVPDEAQDVPLEWPLPPLGQSNLVPRERHLPSLEEERLPPPRAEEPERRPAREEERLPELRSERPELRESVSGMVRIRRVVSTGFASRYDAADTVSSDRTLQAGQPYLYWFEISDRSARDAIDEPRHREVPLEYAAAGTPLTVALFGFPGELEISAGADIGEFVIDADGAAQVLRQPLDEQLEPPRGGMLLFPIRTPDRPGRYRLRCNLYCRQTLLQSRLVEAEVSAEPQGAEQALRSTVDYTVSTTLHPDLLAATRPLRLSILLNDNGDGTHGFRFLGESNLKGDAVIDGESLQDLLDRARKAYRLAAWDSEAEWQPKWPADRYRYRNPPGQQRLAEDLIRMARAGYRLWARLAVQLSTGVRTQLPPGQSPVRSLREIMRRPGFVEVACKHSARMVVPASILYDYPLDTGADPRVCADAFDAIAAGAKADLAGHPCFLGDCAHYDDDAVVCPGGFWGYRHGIGLPQSRGEQADGEEGDAAADSWPEIRCNEKPEFLIGVADDFNGDHVRRVHALGDARSQIVDRRDALLQGLRVQPFSAHMIYFFCHGALVNGIPALQVGPRDSVGITQDNVEDGRMYWAGTHPLVVLNGCSTAAVEPQYALNLVDAFVRGALASGVIGTEITVFESLATLFGDEFFSRFLDYDEPVAEAVRRARLRVLATGNPLGLVYIVYAAPRLQLVP